MHLGEGEGGREALWEPRALPENTTQCSQPGLEPAQSRPSLVIVLSMYTNSSAFVICSNRIFFISRHNLQVSRMFAYGILAVLMILKSSFNIIVVLCHTCLNSKMQLCIYFGETCHTASSTFQLARNLFPFFQMCQKDINTHRQGYNAFCSIGQRIIEDCTGSLSSQASMELDRVSRRWVMITNRVTSNQQQLELSLKDWQEYTSLTENLMMWLREKEKLLRAQSKAITFREVERELDTMKVLRETVLVLFCSLFVLLHSGMSKNYTNCPFRTHFI